VRMKSPRVVERARAKINLTLQVLGQRADGYHALESLVAFADVADIVTLNLDESVSVMVGGPFGPSLAGENLVRVALDKLAVAYPSLKLGSVALEKNLPVAAGVGGGSSDAAAVLRAVRQANSEIADRIDWMTVAETLGADVPVCFRDCPAIMRGVGEQVHPVLNLPPLAVVLVNPRVPVPADKTAQVFKRLNAGPLSPQAPDTGHLAKSDVATRAALLEQMTTIGNDLLHPASAIVPAVGAVMAALSQCDGVELTQLSGGGPTCFAVFPDDGLAHAAANKLRAQHNHWWVVATRLS
jgi:4-diphosphocytidyl-2-C-methyl-D-erythritol kinase